MGIQILDAEADAGAWRRALEGLPSDLQDPYFLPEYVALHRFEPETRAVLFSYSRSGEVWIYPFLLQPINRIGNYPMERTWFDIETAYGYGGPLASTGDAGFVAEAHRAFTEWCREQGVVAEFVRLHPLLENQRWLDPKVQLDLDRETVSISLADGAADDIPMDQGARYMVRRAERSGVEVSAFPPQDHFQSFVQLYTRSMERIDADQYYFFSDDYFAGLSRLVDQNGLLLAAQVDDRWVGAAVFLAGPSRLHYHLAATDSENRVPGVMNLLLYTAAQLAARNGLRQLHLGGGRTRMLDDSLLRFKQSIGTDSHSFYVGKRIHDSDSYFRLRALWEESYPSLVQKYGQRLLCYRYRDEQPNRQEVWRT
jgi:hypothetical protein